MENFRFRVVPCEYHQGFCPCLCETLKDAVEEQQFWQEHTDFLWGIEGLDDAAEQELCDYLEYEAERAMELYEL